MEVTWLGGGVVMLRGREVKVALAPAETDAHNGADIVVAPGEINRLRVGEGPQVVARPGEYELRGVSVRGVQLNGGTGLVAVVDEVQVCNLATMRPEISEDALEALGLIDVLALSLESEAPAAAQAAAALVARLQPNVVVPIGYEPQALGPAPALAAFLKEMGVQEVAPQARLTLTGSSGAGEETRVVLLEPRH